jgi:curved DNA-binding protein CbpA
MDPHSACRVLGVAPNASHDEVKSAYRKCAMQFHPDRNSGGGPELERIAADKFRQAQEAYDVLSWGGQGRNYSRTSGSGSGGGYRSPHSWSSSNPNSNGNQYKSASGYYNGADDPFGFRTSQSSTVGDHMRRIDRNIRTLYITLAIVGVCIYFAPSEKSPSQIAKQRKRRDKPTYNYTERAVTSLAPGSPLDTDTYRNDRRGTGGARRGFSRGRDDTYASSIYDETLAGDDETSYAYAYDGGGERQRLNTHRGSPQCGTVGEREHFESMRRTADDSGIDDELLTQEGDRPEWASGGYSGRGISKRVLPYWKRRGGYRGEEGYEQMEANGMGYEPSPLREAGSGTTLHCARCSSTLPSAARYCSICGARVTSPQSVRVSSSSRVSDIKKTTPLPDPQDTGLNTGRGAARARAERDATEPREGGSQ